MKPRVLSSKRVYDGWVRVRTDHLEWTGPSAEAEQDLSEKEVVEIKPGICILPVLEDRRIALVSQYRHAVGGERWELPCGFIDAGEKPAQAATRELREETALLAAELVSLLTLDVSPGSTNEIVHCFLARGCRPEDWPELKIQTVTVRECVAWIRSGQIRHGTSIAAILHAITTGLIGEA